MEDVYFFFPPFFFPRCMVLAFFHGFFLFSSFPWAGWTFHYYLRPTDTGGLFFGEGYTVPQYLPT